MSVSYQAVGWNPFKKRYDSLLGLGVVAFLGSFIGVGVFVRPEMSLEILLMRGIGVAAFILLHLILAIGPMARLNRRCLPVLYNRRHLGVALFLLALAHAIIAVLTYHLGSDLNPILSIFITDAGTRTTAIPFQAFGFLALAILFVMASTSHDFWLSNLTAPVWKTLHMSVYFAYVLLIAHVVYGGIQAERSPVYLILLGSGILFVVGLHLLSAWRGKALERESSLTGKSGFVAVCQVEALEENRPLSATVDGEQVAVLRYEGNKVSCVSGVCQHQNGPLAEGRFVYGCLTCPWHGYQYRPADGSSPEPFTERVPTFDVRIESGTIWVRSVPNKAGTYIEPVLIDESEGRDSP